MPHSPVSAAGPGPLRFLVAESETAEQRQARRSRVGRSSGESYCATLKDLAPDAACDRITPADADTPLPEVTAIRDYDAVFVTGSPVHVYDGSPETEREIEFMRRVFASGVPAFGSCAGLQLAVVAAGGTVRHMKRQEAGVARRIAPTEAGRDHPLLAGRGPAWDAPGIHGDEVEELPPGATLLASNAVSRVQAAEIRHGPGLFWGVQYHPELSLAEIAAALRRDADDLVESGLALTTAAVEEQARMLEALDRRPDRLDLKWRLGVNAELTDPGHRRTELANFIRHVAARQPDRYIADRQVQGIAAE